MFRDVVIACVPVNEYTRRQLEDQRKAERSAREGNIGVPVARVRSRGLRVGIGGRSQNITVRVPMANINILMKGPGTGNRPPPSTTDPDAEADWSQRINQPGVVWYHDFRNEAEVDNFRWTGGYGSGNDPNDVARPGTCVWQQSDGVTGGACLELYRPDGSADGSGWWRPFSPLDSGNGRGVSDPADDGDLTPQAWSVSPGSDTTSQWHVNADNPGFYGDEQYHSGTDFDGTEYFIQFRIKMDPRRTTSGNTQVGKLIYLTFTPYSNCNQEIVTYSGAFPTPSDVGDPNYHRMYAYNYNPIEDTDTQGRPGMQIGSDLADYGQSEYCDIGSSPGYCWAYSGGWDTLLYHVVPGSDSSSEHHITVYAAHEGETEYTKIWDQNFYIYFDGGYPEGWNAIICSQYNNAQSNSEFWHRYDQLIFSKKFIPCPGNSALTAPSWFTSLTNKEAATPVSNWLGATGVKDPGSGLGIHAAIIEEWTGMGVDQRRKMPFMLHNGGHSRYAGNEVYSVDLTDESPAWIRRRNASTPNPTTGSITKFTDGRPCSDHTGNLYVAAEGRWFTCGMNSTNYKGDDARNQWWEYDPVADDYIDLGSGHYGAGASFGTAIYDENARQVITIHDNNHTPSVTFTGLDAMGSTHSVANNNPLDVSQSPMAAVDTTNKILLLRAGSYYRWLKIDTDANRQGSLGTASVTGTAANSLHQFYWHKASQAFITWGGGNSIAKLTPTVSGGSYTALAWSSVAITGETLPSSGQGAGMYDKVNFIEDMGNGDSALVIVPRYGNPDLYVIRLVGAI